MTDKTALGDRMKAYEFATRAVLPRRIYTLVRVDGRAFHTYLRHAQKPFDFDFMLAMQITAIEMCNEMSGVVFAYLQSDEISILLQDFESPGTQPWFNGNVQKIASVSASIATAVFNSRRLSEPGNLRLAQFDARVFTLPQPLRVAEYFIWRQSDAIRNSISMAAQAHFSHKQLHGVSSGEMQQILWSEHGINWNDYPTHAKRGAVIVKRHKEQTVTYTRKDNQQEESTLALRSFWASQPAPSFTTDPGDFLASSIPAIPILEDV